MLYFAQPAGFWALLAVPAILAVHFLQRETKRVVISTLFLLEQLAPESASGRRWERLRHSVPLWLQLLAALLLTWLLAQPRWVRRQSVQQIVVVLDSTLSLSAFRPELARALERATARLDRVAATTEWRLLETDPARPPLYTGAQRERLLEAATRWEPHLGRHEPAPALTAAQALLRGGGVLLFVSDRPTVLPEGTHLLTVGHPLENSGWAGATCEGRHWRALVKNYGREPQRRTWWIEAKGQKSALQELTLAPGQTSVITGEIPAGADSCEAVLEADVFPLDDRLPLVVPQPKTLLLNPEPGTPFADFFGRFAGSLEQAVVQAEGADLRLAVYDAFQPKLPAGPAIVFLTDPAPGQWVSGDVAVEEAALTTDLNWSGFLHRRTLSLPAKPGDRPLLWQGERPLLFLRSTESGPLLIVNFDLRASNAARLPAFVLLLHRFAEEVRAAKRTLEVANVECHQALNVAADPAGPPPAIPGAEPGPLRAPFRPGFFEVCQGERSLLRGAAQFADVRVADFRDAASQDDLAALEQRLVARNSQADLLTPVWLLALGMVMGAGWVWKEN